MNTSGDNLRRLSLRLNLDKESHVKASSILDKCPNGTANQFIIDAIIEHAEKRYLKAIIKETMKEVMSEFSMHPSPKEYEDKKENTSSNFNENTLNFLNGLNSD